MLWSVQSLVSVLLCVVCRCFLPAVQKVGILQETEVLAVMLNASQVGQAGIS